MSDTAIRQERETIICGIQVASADALKNIPVSSDIDLDKYVVLYAKPITYGDRGIALRDPVNEQNNIYEVILQGALDHTDLHDCVFNEEHGDKTGAVARVRNGTLIPEVLPDGLGCWILLDKNNPRCMQVFQDIDTGLCDGVSFNYVPAENGQYYDYETHTLYVTAIKVMYDVSLVQIPAYANATISVQRRSMVVTATEKAEAELHKKQLISECLLRIDDILAK